MSDDSSQLRKQLEELRRGNEELHARLDDHERRAGRLEGQLTDETLGGRIHGQVMAAVEKTPREGALLVALHSLTAQLVALVEELRMPRERTATLNLPTGPATMTVHERSARAWRKSS
jgi:hypothetical protein